MTKDERKQKLPLLIGALPFLMSGLDAIDRGTYPLAIANLAMVAINLIALRFVATAPAQTTVFVHLCNAALACFLSYDYFQQGKQGLPYAWLVAAACFVVAAWVQHRKSKRPESPVTPPETSS